VVGSGGGGYNITATYFFGCCVLFPCYLLTRLLLALANKFYVGICTF
jgi:hypothetical protein